MAYSTSNPPSMLTQGVSARSLWHYISTDVHTDVDAAGYFTNGAALGMKAGDIVFVLESDNAFALTTHSVVSVSAGGAATISAAT